MLSLALLVGCPASSANRAPGGHRGCALDDLDDLGDGPQDVVDVDRLRLGLDGPRGGDPEGRGGGGGGREGGVRRLCRHGRAGRRHLDVLGQVVELHVLDLGSRHRWQRLRLRVRGRLDSGLVRQVDVDDALVDLDVHPARRGRGILLVQHRRDPARLVGEQHSPHDGVARHDGLGLVGCDRHRPKRPGSSWRRRMHELCRRGEACRGQRALQGGGSTSPGAPLGGLPLLSHGHGVGGDSMQHPALPGGVPAETRAVWELAELRGGHILDVGVDPLAVGRDRGNDGRHRPHLQPVGLEGDGLVSLVLWERSGGAIC